MVAVKRQVHIMSTRERYNGAIALLLSVDIETVNSGLFHESVCQSSNPRDKQKLSRKKRYDTHFFSLCNNPTKRLFHQKGEKIIISLFIKY